MAVEGRVIVPDDRGELREHPDDLWVVGPISVSSASADVDLASKYDLTPYADFFNEPFSIGALLTDITIEEARETLAWIRGQSADFQLVSGIGITAVNQGQTIGDLVGSIIDSKTGGPSKWLNNGCIVGPNAAFVDGEYEVQSLGVGIWVSEHRRRLLDEQ